MLQNVRLFKEGIEDDIAGSLSSNNQVSESIGAVIDINDRYGYNSCKDYKTDSSKLGIVVDKMTEVINRKLEGLIERGVY